MTRVLLDQIIETDYGQFDLGWGDGFEGFAGDFDEVFAGQVNGLAGAAHPGGLSLNLARRSGGSPVGIELMDSKPANDELWEDVVEVSIAVGAGAEPGWMTWAGEDGGPLELPPGSFRVRVCARGRDAGADDEFAEKPVDFYLIQVWPAESRPEAIVRTTARTRRTGTARLATVASAMRPLSAGVTPARRSPIEHRRWPMWRRGSRLRSIKATQRVPSATARTRRRTSWCPLDQGLTLGR